MLQGVLSNPQVAGTIAAAMIAAVAGIISAMYARRTQQLVGNHQSEFQKQVESLKDLLERTRSLNLFIRDRIVTHLDNVFNSYEKISALLDLIALRSWTITAGKYPETEAEFHFRRRSIFMNLGALKALGAITQEVHDKCQWALSRVKSEWDDVAGELTLRDPEFRKQYPTKPEFSEDRFVDGWRKLQDASLKLHEEILRLTTEVSLPT